MGRRPRHQRRRVPDSSEKIGWEVVGERISSPRNHYEATNMSTFFPELCSGLRPSLISSLISSLRDFGVGSISYSVRCRGLPIRCHGIQNTVHGSQRPGQRGLSAGHSLWRGGSPLRCAVLLLSQGVRASIGREGFLQRLLCKGDVGKLSFDKLRQRLRFQLNLAADSAAADHNPFQLLGRGVKYGGIQLFHSHR